MDDSRPYTTAQRLQEIMATRHLRQVDILRLAKPFEDEFGVVIRKNDLSQYIHGKSEPGQEKLYVLAAALGVSEPWLMGYDVDPDRGATPISSVEKYPTHTYPYIPADISAGPLLSVDAITVTDTITLPDVVVGKYAGRSNLRFMHVNGDSMDRLIPDGSLIGVEELDDITDLRKNDIVVFCDDDVDYSVKRFSNNSKSQSYIFSPVSNNDAYEPIVYRYEDAGNLKIIGRVVLYVVNM